MLELTTIFIWRGAHPLGTSLFPLKLFLYLGIISVFPLIPLHAQDVVKDGITVVDPDTAPRPTLQAVRINSPISVDGFLDESVWQEAEIITGFIQSRPNTGYPSSENTVVRVLYDEDNLYVGAIMYEKDPSDITVHSLKRDFSTGDTDIFGVAIDTYLDRRNGFLFGVNPKGAFADLQGFDNGREINFAWDGVVSRAAHIHEEGWTVEIAIPFTTLRFDPTKINQDWGLNFIRRIRRRNEDSFWAPIDRRFSLNRFALAGKLTGLSGMSSGLNLMIKPYVLAARSSGEALAGKDSDKDINAGLDIKYGVSRRLTLDLTYLTDFSQVEVDDEQLNLTRFSLFFPEKRDFFVENAGMFEFGDSPERGYRLGASFRDFKLFHSRRIGLEDGRPVPVLGGGRLTGRVGGWDLGFLNMQTRSTNDVTAQNFTTLRFRREYRNQLGTLQVGGILMNREVTDDAPGAGFNRSFGADLYARIFKNMVIHSYIAGTQGSTRGNEEDGSRRAARVSVAWRDKFLDTSVMFRTIGRAFNPEMGFIRRRGIYQTYATVGFYRRQANALLNELNPFVEVDYITNPQSVLETRMGTAGLVTSFIDGSRLTLKFSDRLERLFDSFNVLGAQNVSSGLYKFREGSLDFSSSRGRKLSTVVSLSGGGYYGGTRRTIRFGGLWKPNYHFSFDLSAQFNRIDLGSDPFNAEVYSGRVEYAYSTTLFGSGFIQYNGITEELITNVRVNFIHAPLSDFFIVYTERRNVNNGTILDRQLSAKFTKLWSF